MSGGVVDRANAGFEEDRVDDADAPTSAKHTPGPWQFYADLPSTEPNWHIVTNASRTRVLANIHIEPGSAMDLANAHVITAAPNLRAALQALVDLRAEAERTQHLVADSDIGKIVAWQQRWVAAFAVARAALAKAAP